MAFPPIFHGDNMRALDFGPEKLPSFTRNNFHLLRLLAALQVAVLHSSEHLHVNLSSGGFIRQILELFPGVPVFFFISGFLITRSYEQSRSLRTYAANRWLRIFPGLWACWVISLALVCLSGFALTFSSFEFLRWAAAQLTVLQFYNPGFLRHYGSGVLNGSLWTISVELQFYVLTPVLCRWLSAHASPQRRNIAMLALMASFMLFNRLFADRLARAGSESGLALKLWAVSFIPWFYMFLLGAICQQNYPALIRLLGGRFGAVAVIYLCVALVGRRCGLALGNEISPVLYLTLAAVIFSAAYSWSGLAEALVGRNDISYGVYIYHMPIVNALIQGKLPAQVWTLAVALSVTVTAAIFSWIAVEKPCLGLKRKSLYRSNTRKNDETLLMPEGKRIRRGASPTTGG